jgi:hypothetical protein
MSARVSLVYLAVVPLLIAAPAMGQIVLLVAPPAPLGSALVSPDSSLLGSALASTGAPQWGQYAAFSVTSPLHALHLADVMPGLFCMTHTSSVL